MEKSISFIIVFVFLGCGGTDETSFSSSSQETTSWFQPNLSISFQWQLQGEINAEYDVDLYDIDLFDTPTQTIQKFHQDGKKVVCYFSAGSYEAWREDAGDFLQSDKGKQMSGWDELWLDIRSENVKEIMKNRIELAVQKGCDAVEPDNIDGYTNDTGFALTYGDQINFNTFLAQTAHTKGLAIALKNDLKQIDDLVSSFDFALNEQCHEFAGDCEYLQRFIQENKPVFNVEYSQEYIDDQTAFEALCQDSALRGFYTLVLPYALDDSFRKSCQ